MSGSEYADHAALLAEGKKALSYGLNDYADPYTLVADLVAALESLVPRTVTVDVEALAGQEHGLDCSTIAWSWDGVEEGETGQPCDCWKSVLATLAPLRRLSAEEVAERLGIRGYGAELFTVTLAAAGLAVFAVPPTDQGKVGA